MSYSHYDRLSALDATFLEVEDAKSHMHIGSVSLFDAAPLRGESGGIDFERILAAQEWSLQHSERFRQKLAYVPGVGHPVWVDDDRFNLLYHVRHTALPAPGTIRQLKRLAGRVMSQQLDRGKPLWEVWFVEGVEGDRFATITKLHHCMADGISGTDLFSSMMGSDPEYRPGEPRPWVPRPAPSGAQLLAGEAMRRARLPLSLAQAGARLLRRGEGTPREIARGLGESLSAGLGSASDTPLNADLGPHRRFDWTRSDLAEMKEIGKRFDGKLNDVVLAVVAGAIGRFLRGRGLHIEGIDFRAMVPVSVRNEKERDKPGNKVSQMLARLPVDVADPVKRLAQVVEMTTAMKSSGQRAGGEALAELAEWTGVGLMPLLSRLALRARAVNLVVTNVPGPPKPLYLLGAPLQEVYPVVPLADHLTLGIALFSYAGGLHWGFNADWDVLPDLHVLVEAVEEEIEALRKATGAPARQA